MAYSCDIVTDNAAVTGVLKGAAVVSTLMASAAFASSVVIVVGTTARESAEVSGTASENRYVVIRETARITGRAIPTVHGANVVRERAAIGSSVFDVVGNIARDPAVVLGTAYPGGRFTDVFEIAKVRDRVAQTALSHNIAHETAALNSRAVQQADAVLRETAAVHGVALSHRIAKTVSRETAVIHGVAASFIHSANVVRERAVLRDAISSTLHAVDSVRETAAIDGYLVRPLAGMAWTAPTDTFAMSRYTQFRFNSAAVIGGRVIAAGDAGLYELQGDDDAGAAVPAKVVTGMSDLGDPSQKRVREAFFGYESAEPLALTVAVTGDGVETAYTYEMPAKTADAPTANRIKVGRGLKSRFWRFTISNPSGNAFKVNEARVAVDPLSRKI